MIYWVILFSNEYEWYFETSYMYVNKKCDFKGKLIFLKKHNTNNACKEYEKICEKKCMWKPSYQGRLYTKHIDVRKGKIKFPNKSKVKCGYTFSTSKL